MKIWHISDTHTFHQNLKIPECDLIIHSGDFCSSANLSANEEQFYSFVNWWKGLDKQKIAIPGNHDLFVERNEKVAKRLFAEANSVLLIHESIEINGLKIFGSPFTPEFHNWAYNKARGKLFDCWKKIPIDTDIIVTHGPPKGILDLSENKMREIEQCGCSALRTIIDRIKPKAALWGHLHDYKDYKNQGVFIRDNVVYSNAACVTDGKFKEGLTSYGNIITI